jgi:Mor family transcriptional regulator
MQKTELVPFPKGYPEVLEQVGQVVARKLREEGIEATHAGQMVFDITEGIRTEVGGIQVYIPRGIRYEFSQRDQEIYAAFNGTNYNALSQQHGLSSVQVRNIIKRCQQAEREARKTSPAIV